MAFLRAILSQPRVLIMDEVFSSLDKEDVSYIIDLCKESVDIVFIVTRKKDVLEYANKFIEL